MSWLARKRVALGLVTAVAAIVLARPTWTSWWVGLGVALAGEGLRVWAAGHLEKGREVTHSGPYRLTRHPLYAGSCILALGVVIAARSLPLALLAALYLSVTITAAIRTEEAFLRRTFGDAYDRYARPGRARSGESGSTAAAETQARPFSLARAVRNREYRAVVGVLVGFALLALKIVLSI
jgi:protein-S-isoprenylcysteine O-methyltransferase Ste14